MGRKKNKVEAKKPEIIPRTTPWTYPGEEITAATTNNNSKHWVPQFALFELLVIPTFGQKVGSSAGNIWKLLRDSTWSVGVLTIPSHCDVMNQRVNCRRGI